MHIRKYGVEGIYGTFRVHRKRLCMIHFFIGYCFIQSLQKFVRKLFINKNFSTVSHSGTWAKE